MEIDTASLLITHNIIFGMENWRKLFFYSHQPPILINIQATSWENLFLPYANNKDADQPVHPRSLVSIFVVHCLDNIICLVSISEISSLYLASVAEQAVLSVPWSQTQRQVFSRRGSIFGVET